MHIRELAQLGRALGLGPRGRRFESCIPDNYEENKLDICLAYFFLKDNLIGKEGKLLYN